MPPAPGQDLTLAELRESDPVSALRVRVDGSAGPSPSRQAVADAGMDRLDEHFATMAQRFSQQDAFITKQRFSRLLGGLSRRQWLSLCERSGAGHHERRILEQGELALPNFRRLLELASGPRASTVQWTEEEVVELWDHLHSLRELGASVSPVRSGSSRLPTQRRTLPTRSFFNFLEMVRVSTNTNA